MRESAGLGGADEASGNRLSWNESSVGDLTLIRLLGDDQTGNPNERAAAEFVSRYLEKLLSLIERNTAARYQSRFDPEDVAQSVLMSWIGAVHQGEVHPSCQDEIWKLLSVIALCKVRNRVRFHDAEKRRVARTDSQSALPFVAVEPQEQDAVEFSETLESLAKNLPERASRVLQLILEGHGVAEIAEKLDVSTKTVQREKNRIGKQLMELIPGDLTDGIQIHEDMFS